MQKVLLFVLSCVALWACSSAKHSVRNKPLPIVTVQDTVVMDTLFVKANRDNPYRGAATQVNDILHTKLEVKFDWQKQYLFGKATLTIKPYFYSTSSLELDAKGMEIKEVALVKNGSLHLPLPYHYDSKKIKIELPRTYTMVDTYTIYLEYVSKPNELEHGGSAAIHDDKGLYFINPLNKEKNKPRQIWTQGEVHANSCWFPTIDEPNEKFTDEILITYDNHLTTLSNGILASSKDNGDGTATDDWKMDQPHSAYLVMMAVGNFMKTSQKWKGIDVGYYLEPKYAPYALDIFGNTPEMIDYFSKLLGVDYPWKKYAQIVVRDYVSGAMENTSATLHGEEVQQTKRERIDGNRENVLSHELFHQWFGDLVTARSWSNVPLHESFATYGEYLWNEHKNGREFADYELHNNLEKYLGESRAKSVPLVRYHYDNPDDLFDRHSYDKGGCILHLLRNIIGDEAFFKALQLYLKRYAFKNAELDQLREAFEEVSGQDLHWFFNQWFFTAGHPVLDIHYNWTNDSVLVKIEQKHNTDEKFVYRLPMKIDVWYGNQKERHEVELNKQTQTFAFARKGKPDLIDADAERVLVGEKKENKTAQNYSFQYHHCPLYLQKAEALDKLADLQNDSTPVAKGTLTDALRDSFYIFREGVLEDFNLDTLKDANLYEHLLRMATHDSSSLVRTAALKKLTKRKDKKYQPAFEQALNDSSYKVIAAALLGLNDLDKNEAVEKAKQFENETNYAVVNAVSTIYAASEDTGYSTFFETKLETAQKYSKYYLLYHYANYLIGKDTALIAKGIETIYNNTHLDNSTIITSAGKGSLRRIQKSIEGKKKTLITQQNSTDSELSKAKLSIEIAGYEKLIARIKECLKGIGEGKDD